MKLYRFGYSPYARKVEMLLELAGIPFEAVEVPYGDRTELVEVTGGYLQVPVLVDRGTVVTESRAICEHLLVGDVGAELVPSPWQGPIWAYADFADGPLEDVLFRFASPTLARQKRNAADRALFIFIKERKFGSGCVDLWHTQRADLVARGRRLLAPSVETVRRAPFLFGERPTLADAALYGNLAMLEGADPEFVVALGSELVPYMRRLEAARRTSLTA
jgi:glutathione S-transferase